MLLARVSTCLVSFLLGRLSIPVIEEALLFEFQVAVPAELAMKSCRLSSVPRPHQLVVSQYQRCQELPRNMENNRKIIILTN